jgi:hypothetical protein
MPWLGFRGFQFEPYLLQRSNQDPKISALVLMDNCVVEQTAAPISDQKDPSS